MSTTIRALFDAILSAWLDFERWTSVGSRRDQYLCKEVQGTRDGSFTAVISKSRRSRLLKDGLISIHLLARNERSRAETLLA